MKGHISKITNLTNLQIGEKNPNARSWKLTSPTGEEYLIKGTLKQFCLENNLSYSTVRTSYYLKRTMRSKDSTIAPGLTIDNCEYRGNAVIRANQ